jgi:hypothetical protein
LTHEAELAKTAIGNTLAELKTELAKAGDVRLWAHHYPWVTLGVAAATGFTLAAIVNKAATTPETADEKQRSEQIREAAKAPYDSKRDKSKPRLGDSLLGSLFSLARTALEASLVSAIRAEGVERVQAEAASSSSSPAHPDIDFRAQRTEFVADPMSSAGL